MGSSPAPTGTFDFFSCDFLITPLDHYCCGSVRNQDTAPRCPKTQTPMFTINGSMISKLSFVLEKILDFFVYKANAPLYSVVFESFVVPLHFEESQTCRSTAHGMGQDPGWHRKLRSLVGRFSICCVESIDVASVVTSGSGRLDLSTDAVFRRDNVVVTGRHHRGTWGFAGSLRFVLIRGGTG